MRLDCALDGFPQVEKMVIARIALPPDGGDADLGPVFHGVFRGNAGAVEHGLLWG